MAHPPGSTVLAARAAGAPVTTCLESCRPVRLILLGGFRLLHGVEEVQVPASAQRLIALLGLHERPLSRPYIAGSLWPGCSAERSLADLRTALWRANGSSGPLISSTGMRLHLHADVQVDTRALVNCGHALSGVLPSGLFPEVTGISLTELSLDLLPDWCDDWVVEEREAIRQIRLHVLEGIATELSARGRHAEAIHAALIAIRLEPLRETAHATLIRAHLAEGNRSEALRQFKRLRRLLREELGVEPTHSIGALVQVQAVQSRPS
jgi:DNA-binding SARP family transcriptional activator